MTDLVIIVLISLVALVFIAGVALIFSYYFDRERLRVAEQYGVWYGTDKPPEGFRGYWFDGRVHQVYPMDVKVSHLTAEEIADLEEDWHGSV